MAIQKEQFLPVADYEQRLLMRVKDAVRVVRVLAVASVLIFLLALLLCFTNSGLAAVGATLVGAVLLGWAWHEKSALYPYEGLVDNSLLRELHYFLQRISLLITVIMLVEVFALIMLVLVSHGNPLAVLRSF